MRAAEIVARWVVVAACAGAGAQQVKPVDVFAPIVDAVARKTPVPVRLPTALPKVEGAENALTAHVQSANEKGYEIEVGEGPICEAGHACHYGLFSGSKEPMARLAQLKSVPVALAGGIRGTYARLSYGGYCSGSHVLWSQGGFFYAISMNCASREEMQRVANAAIGSRRGGR